MYTEHNLYTELNIIQSMFSDHNDIKLGTNNKSKNVKTPYFCKLRHTVIYNPWIKEKSEWKFGNILKFEILTEKANTHIKTS